MPSLKSTIATYSKRLETAGVYSPRADAENIAATILGIPRDELMNRGDEITPVDLEKMEAALQQREQRVPFARIFGHVWFRGLRIDVVEGVFDPMIEAEAMIDFTHMMLEQKAKEGEVRILDMGSGSGCLLFALVNEIPHATGVGVDINEKAVTSARANAERLHLNTRTDFVVSDWLSQVNERFDVVIANVPSVPSDLIPRLQREVYSYDPHNALDGGPDGFNFYRRFARDFEKIAKPDAIGLFQTVYDVADQVSALFRKEGYMPKILRNHLGVPMCICIRADQRRLGLFQRLKRSLFSIGS
jgi:release factor glutamine methyltransferase